MEQKKKESAKVYKQREIALGIYDMWIDTTLASQAKPGQFISVYTQDKSALLPRPISICEADTINSRLRIVYRVAGKGTAEFSSYETGHRGAGKSRGKTRFSDGRRNRDSAHARDGKSH